MCAYPSPPPIARWQFDDAVRADLIGQALASSRLKAPRQPCHVELGVASLWHHEDVLRAHVAALGVTVAPGATDLIEGLLVVLVPEPWNPYDPDAIAVALDGREVGHLWAEEGRGYARLLNALAASGWLATAPAEVFVSNLADEIRPSVSLALARPSAFSRDRP